MNYRHIGAALLAALALAATAVPAGATSSEEDQARRDLERARQEVEKARTELQKATRELARSMAKLERDNPKVQYFEYMTDPKRAVLGVLIPDDHEADETRGVQLLAVTPGSGAEKAGLKAGDVVVSLNGSSLAAQGKKTPQKRMREVMRTLKAGDEVKVEYERDGRARSTTVVTQAPEPELSLMPPMPSLENLENMENFGFMKWGFRGPAIRGLELAKLDEDLGAYFKTTDGVLVVKASKGAALGLKSGDVIQKIDGVSVSEPVTVLDKLRSRGEEQTVAIDILRQGRKLQLQGQIPVAEATPAPMAPMPPVAPRPPRTPRAATPAPTPEAPPPPSSPDDDDRDI